MKKSPIIGITTFSGNEVREFTLPGTYIDAVRGAGGVPVLLPPGEGEIQHLLGVVDGLIFSGGGDIDPTRYGGEHHPMVYLVNPERDDFELALAKAALQAHVPVLGICRGSQILTIASGGTLVAHVPDLYSTTVGHRHEHPSRPIEHEVALEPDSRLAKILGETKVMVVSWHHQAVQQVPADWQVVARARDGVVEAMEHQSHPWAIAVQWHPEMSAPESVHPQLFQALIQAASQSRVPSEPETPVPIQRMDYVKITN
ncbi:peptidase C26 [Leptolyngbya sp. 'hensonii']|uniref:gamma-glutamyl-gamma-aminobutyrate hydrolase family protein n=1 Tax=Leptolyngbya sp. 'hensonii' TaxID=1922337 RepID=UPI00094F5DE2|nr:gamma-glutamyl-gamma-aminobutyrate hydrolase family protein [Leptolyngbya sp. 'hensonii']OLP18010.1 peptidase C26 [Leptolyngbya sp. 'hensonii']